jgi:NADP-dependent 3-hydroxy acid dehydrogenase YdfG
VREKIIERAGEVDVNAAAVVSGVSAHAPHLNAEPWGDVVNMTRCKARTMELQRRHYSEATTRYYIPPEVPLSPRLRRLA